MSRLFEMAIMLANAQAADVLKGDVDKLRAAILALNEENKEMRAMLRVLVELAEGLNPENEQWRDELASASESARAFLGKER